VFSNLDQFWYINSPVQLTKKALSAAKRASTVNVFAGAESNDGPAQEYQTIVSVQSCTYSSPGNRIRIRSNPAADELAEARVELDRLEKQEQDLLAQLHTVRNAAQVQRTRIKELVKRIPTPISYLPNEILLQIIQLSLRSSINHGPNSSLAYYRLKKELAGVSRRWRDVILRSPVLWTTIKVTPAWGDSLMKTHITRSSQSPLDVDFCYWTAGKDMLIAMLDLLVPCAHRWRSLIIRDSVPYFHLSLVLQRIGCLSFPSLKRVSITPRHFDEVSDDWNSRFLRPGSSCQLEYLELGRQFVVSADFKIPSCLSTLVLELHHGENAVLSSLLELPSCARLTVLSLSGNMGVFHQQPPNSVQLPLLDKLICKAADVGGLLHAIVAPKLRHFEYRPIRVDDISADLFTGLESKFSNVSQIVLFSSGIEHDIEFVCLAFPGVRHAVLHEDDAKAVFASMDTVPTSTSWQHLESLAIEGSHVRHHPDYLGTLVAWLRERQFMGRPNLRVKLCSFQGDPSWFSAVQNALQEQCTVEWVNIHLIANMGVSSTAGGSLCTQWSVGKFSLAFSFLELTHTLLGKAVSDLSSGFMDGVVENMCSRLYTSR